jgi:hypothetical protein
MNAQSVNATLTARFSLQLKARTHILLKLSGSAVCIENYAEVRYI